MSIFKFIEDDDFNGFKDYVTNNIESLKELDNDQWGVLSLLVHYNMPEYVDFIFPLMDADLINKSTPLHPLFVALEDNDLSFIKKFITYEKINFNVIYKNNENIVHYLVHRGNEDLALAILEKNKISDVFTESLDGQLLLSLCISKGYNKIVDYVINLNNFDEKYNNKFLLDSIKYNNFESFEKLYNYSDTSNIDELFNIAISYKNINVVNFLLNTGDIIPGQKQITELVDLVAKVYENEFEQNAADEIIDFLFSVKTNFNNFVNTNGENIWILAIKNNNNSLFDKLVHENNESLEFENSDNQTPLFFAIEHLNLSYVKKLLNRKANPSHLDYIQNNALIFAIGQECFTKQDLEDKQSIVDEILKYRNDLNHINKHNESALSLAVHKKNMSIVSSLLWKGANLAHNPAKFIHQQDMFQFSNNGSFEMLEPIIEEKSIDNFVALKQLGFNLSQKNENGDSLAMFFVKEGYWSNFLAIFKLLTTEEVNEVDNSGNSLIMNAIKKKTDDYALKILFYFNEINLNTKNKDGQDVYDICAGFGNVKKMESLLNHDSNLTPEKIKKSLPLLLKHSDISKYWKEFVSIDPSIIEFKDIDKNNLLMLAASTGNFNNVYFLLEQNIKFNQKDSNSQKQTILDILVSLSEEHETNVANTLDILTKKLKKKP